MSAFGNYEVWGLTGGIASGKSQAARFFVEAGVPVIDADLIARELGQPSGAAHASIVKRFGTDDRAQLRKIVFADPVARKDLEAILHPLIVAESLKRMTEIAHRSAGPSSAAGKPLIIYEAALLVETGRYRDLSGLIVIDAPRELRRTRLITRDGVPPELADQILNSQATDEQRRAVATVIIPNSGTIEEFRAAVKRWVAQHRG